MLYGFTYIYSSYLGYKMHIHIFCQILKYLAGYWNSHMIGPIANQNFGGYKSLARYWNYHLQSILPQNRDNGPMNLT